MKKAKAGIALSAVFFLAACSVAEVRGTVVELEHEQSKTICASKKPGSKIAPKCTTVAECFEIDVRDSQGVEHEFCLDEADWRRYRINDLYPHKYNY